MKISDQFKLMRITPTQTIAHYSVNFDLIHKSFEKLALQSMDSVKKIQGHSISSCAGRRG